MSKDNFRELSRKFKGVWCPAHLWLYEDMNVMEKMFYLEIDSLDNENGCIASNDHFSKFSGLSKSRCSEIIKSLESKGILSIKYTYKIRKGKQTKEVDQRIIRINPAWERSIRAAYEAIQDDLDDQERKATEPPVEIEEKIQDQHAEDPLRDSEDPPFEKPKTPFEKPKDRYTLLDKHILKDNDDVKSSEIIINDTQINLFVERFNSVAKKQVKIITKQRKEKLQVLINTYGIDSVMLVCDAIKESSYLTENLDFSHMVDNEELFANVVNGKYKDREKVTQAAANGSVAKSKNPHFTTTYSHGWDLDELEKREMDHVAKLYGEPSPERSQWAKDLLSQIKYDQEPSEIENAIQVKFA